MQNLSYRDISEIICAYMFNILRICLLSSAFKNVNKHGYMAVKLNNRHGHLKIPNLIMGISVTAFK